MISNELLEEVIAVSSKGEYLSKGLLTRITISLIEQCDPLTKSLFQEFCFINSKEDVFGLCTREDGLIEYNYWNVIDDVKNLRQLPYLQANLCMISYVMHEIEHLKEYYKQEQKNFESKLIINSSANFIVKLLEYKYLPNIFSEYKLTKLKDKIISKKYKKFYMSIWNIFPDEKIAEADSFKLLFDSVIAYPNFKETNKEDCNYIIKEYIERLLTGYYNKSGEYNIPLKEYLQEIKKIDIKNKLDSTIEKEMINIEKYTIEDRLKYGLSITHDDIKELKNKCLTKIS